MKKTFRSSFLLFLSFLALRTEAQQSVVSRICLSGHFQDFRQARVDSVQLLYRQQYLPDQQWGQIKMLLPDDNGGFSADLEVSEHTGKLAFFIYGEKTYMTNEYYFEPGDSVHVEFKRDKAGFQPVFSRTGAAKYQIIEVANAQRERFLASPLGFLQNMAEKRALLDSCQRLSLEKLDQQKDSMGQKMCELLEAEITGFYKTQWMANLFYYYLTEKDSDIRSVLRQEYVQLIREDSPGLWESGAFSNYYLLYQLEKSKFDLYLKSMGKGYGFAALYNYLRSSYTGALRERLLLMCLDSHRALDLIVDFDQQEYQLCLEDARQTIATPFLQEVLTGKLLLKQGANVYDFQLPDKEGRIVSLKDFKGKVVLIDLWARGCTGCAQFARMFESQIQPELTNRPDFEVVSISLDKSREIWLQSIQSGKYTNQNHVNLYAEKAFQADFAKYYQITSIPFIILVDRQGRVVSKLSPTMKAGQILRLITNSLDEG